MKAAVKKAVTGKKPAKALAAKKTTRTTTSGKGKK